MGCLENGGFSSFMMMLKYGVDRASAGWRLTKLLSLGGGFWSRQARAASLPKRA